MAKAYDLDQLRSLVAVARHGTVSEGARMLHRSPSAISVQLKSLEEALGRRLFRRHPRGVVLTREGELVLEHVKKILALTQEMEGSFDGEPLVGEVRIGLTPDLAASRLPRILRDVVEWRQAFELQLIVAVSKELENYLRNGGVDLALAATEFVSLAPQVTWRTPLVWAASRDFQLNLARPLPLALSRRNPRPWEQCSLDSLRACGLSWRVALSASEITSVITAIEVGVGIGLVTADCVKPTMRVLSEIDGLPAPPIVEFGLFQSSTEVRPGLDTLSRLIRTAIHGP